MSAFTDYKEAKRIKESDLPIMWVVYSDRSGVIAPKECQVKNITYGSGLNLTDNKKIDTYYLVNDTFPWEINIEEGKDSGEEFGYGSGFGDLWAWTAFCSLSKEKAEEHYKTELERVTKKYNLVVIAKTIFSIFFLLKF